jgi:hypothetical protein
VSENSGVREVRRPIATGALILLLLTAACTRTVTVVPPETTTTTPLPGVLTCGHLPAQIRPRTIVVACGDGNAGAKSLSWTSWSPDAATGVGDYYQNDCTPDCAQGVFIDYPAVFTLSVLGQGPSGPLFTVLTAKFTNSSPSGEGSTESWSLASYGSP